MCLPTHDLLTSSRAKLSSWNKSGARQSTEQTRDSTGLRSLRHKLLPDSFFSIHVFNEHQDCKSNTTDWAYYGKTEAAREDLVLCEKSWPDTPSRCAVNSEVILVLRHESTTHQARKVYALNKCSTSVVMRKLLKS